MVDGEEVVGGEEDQEEEAWLDALEAGQVNERGYLPEKRGSSSLTARQVHKTRDLSHYNGTTE